MLNIAELGNCIPVRSGRAALVAAITAAGCTMRFIDIDPKTYCISPDDLAAQRSQADAVVAVHMFGNLCDITDLMAAVRNKPIIEE